MRPFSLPIEFNIRMVRFHPCFGILFLLLRGFAASKGKKRNLPHRLQICTGISRCRYIHQLLFSGQRRQIRDPVIRKPCLIQMLHPPEGRNIADLISVQSQIIQICQRFQGRNILDMIFRQPKPLQLGKACPQENAGNCWRQALLIPGVHIGSACPESFPPYPRCGCPSHPIHNPVSPRL